MQSMFNAVQSEINRIGSGAKVTDYLNFFCLGNREAGPQPQVGNDKGALCERNRRFMIYVHSKCMIVDDEVAIIGVCLHPHFAPRIVCVPRLHAG